MAYSTDHQTNRPTLYVSEGLRWHRALLCCCFVSLIVFSHAHASDGQANPSSHARQVSNETKGSKRQHTLPTSIRISIPPDALAQGPADAPITIVEFSDFECPFCGRSAPVIADLLQAYPNKIRLIFKNNPLNIHPHARLAHEAALAAAQQGKFWQMYDLLFANQTKLEPGNLQGYAKQLNLDMNAVNGALNAHSYGSLIDRDLGEAKGFGVEATPTFFVNGQKLVGAQTLATFKTIVDRELGQDTPVTEEQAPPLNFTEVKLDDAPIRGAPNAPITILEYADFQCPYCSASESTLQQLLVMYPGQIRIAFKNYPLDIHEDAMLAHHAALAAKQQGRFWEMHDRLFSNQRALKRADLIHTAQGLGLDTNKFIADMDSPQFTSTIEADKNEGRRLGVEGTPSFFINGKMLEGAQPIGEFKKLIDQALHDRTSPSAAGEQPTSAGSSVSDARGYVTGQVNAPIHIAWYADLQSPLALDSARLIKELMERFPDTIRLEFKNFPLPIHADAKLAHEAVLAAAAQGKFWEMEDRIAQNRSALKEPDLIRYAVEVGLEQGRFSQELRDGIYLSAIESDLSEGLRQNLRGAPVFIVNGKRIDGIQPLSSLTQLIEEDLKQAHASIQ